MFVDPNQLFFDETEHLQDLSEQIGPPVHVVNNSRSTICRPNSSFTRIQLFEKISNRYLPLSVGPQTDVEFDPQYGFHIKITRNERYRCVAKLNQTIKVITKTMTLQRKSNLILKLILKIEFIFQTKGGLDWDPVLNDFDKKYVFVGENVTLQCMARVHPAGIFVMDWKVDHMCSKVCLIVE